MPTTPRPRHAILRAKAPQRVYDWINSRKCIHVDVWLYQMPSDMLYFVIIGSIAGRVKTPAFHKTFRIDPFAMHDWHNIPNVVDVGVARRLGGPWSRKNAPWAMQYHDAIRDLVATKCAQYPRRSVKLHYVYTKLTVDDPMQGIENTYAGSSRAARDAVEGISVRDARREAAIAMAGKPASPWTAKERSLLRTLQKILS